MPRSIAGAKVAVEIDGDAKGLDHALKESSKGLEIFGHDVTLKGVASVASLAGAAGIAASKIMDMTQAAAEDRDEVNKLEAVYLGAGAATEGYTQSIQAAIDAGAAKAFSDSEVRTGLENLVVATGDAEAANRLLGPSMDIARLAGVSLEQATKAVALATQGQDTALRKMIPGLEKGETATDTLANATKLAAGQADTYAESSEGMRKAGKDAFSEIGETIGSAFLPVLDAVLPALLPIITLIGELAESLLPILLPLINLLADALTIVAKALEIVVGWVVKLIDKIGALMSKVRDLLPDLGRLGGIGNSISGAVASGETAGTYAATPYLGSSAQFGNLTINISGDPAIVEREVLGALRTYARRQGKDVAWLTS